MSEFNSEPGDTNQYRCGKVYALTGMQVHTRCGLPAHNDNRNRAAPHPAPNLLRPRALSGAVSVGHALSEYTPSLFKLEPHHHRPLRMAYPHTNNDPSPATKQTRGHGTSTARPRPSPGNRVPTPHNAERDIVSKISILLGAYIHSPPVWNALNREQEPQNKH